MNIVIAPDSFKDCLSAADVAKYLVKGIKRVDRDANIRMIPLADGGEGFVQTMISAIGGKTQSLTVSDPLGREILGFYGILNDGRTAVIEMAAASGIEHLSKEERSPLLTSTYGTGELVKDAMAKGCRKIIIGIGGSATNDGGTGMARALGYRFLDKDDKELMEGGGFLDQLVRIDVEGVIPLIKETEIWVACDVTNPLIGKHGASFIYGPQKGATPDMVEVLDQNLTHLGEIIKKDLGIDVSELSGGGAAGGLGAGLVAFAGGELQPGFDIVKEQTQLDAEIKQADFVITGEGKIDAQTKHGKTPWGVAQIARKYNKPLIAVAGLLGDGYRELYDEGFTSIFALPNGPTSLVDSIRNAPDLLADAGERIYRIIKIGIG